jgi:hypothetical protein
LACVCVGADRSTAICVFGRRDLPIMPDLDGFVTVSLLLSPGGLGHTGGGRRRRNSANRRGYRTEADMATTTTEPAPDLRAELEASLLAFLADMEGQLPPPPETGSVTRIDRHRERRTDR